MDKSESEKAFEEYRRYLLVEAQKLTSFIFVYRQIEELSGTRMDAMRWAPAFFRTTQDALWTSIIHWTHNLFDLQSKRGFANFLSFAAENISLFSLAELQRRKGFPDEYMTVRKPVTHTDIRQDKKRLASIVSLQSIKLRRNKFHAHFDDSYFFRREQLQQDAPLEWNDLKEIEVTMDHVLNRYSHAYDATGYVLRLANIGDLEHLLIRVK